MTKKQKIDKYVLAFIEEFEEEERKFPSWPEDIIHAVSIMNEEAGESIQAAIDVFYKNNNTDHLENELIQTAAMCLRTLVNLNGGNNGRR